MANEYATIADKGLLDQGGVGTLWTRIRTRYDGKLDEVKAKDKSIAITNKNEIAVAISKATGNAITLKDDGLHVQEADAADTYTVTKLATPNTGYAASYKLQKYIGGTGDAQDVAGAAVIDIPKDMVVESGAVETKSAAGAWGEAGTYIHLVLANADNSDLYINVGDLIEYVTSGSQVGDMVYVTVDPTTHKVTATITDGTVTKAKLAQAVQDSLDKADSAVQEVTTGSSSGTISVDGTDVKIKDIDTAAYKKVEDFDAAGAADAVLGTDSDAATKATVYGVKEYVSEAYTAIKALTTAEIDKAIADANKAIDGE